ncbi:MAG: nucleotidyltransferase domain-containing protein [Bdellovibrionota bacterium]
MVNRIVSGFQPEKVILFGSYARGDAGPDSDVDLAVIFPKLEGKCRDKAVRILTALHGMGLAKDVIVLTRQDYEEQKDLVGTIGNILAREGRVLYPLSQ